jgi:hypothetical protein
MVTAAGWLAIVAGAVVTLLGLLLAGAIFSGRGVPVSGAGLFLVLSLGAGPLLTLAGITIVVSGFKLMGGYAWARTVLESVSWVALCASIGWLIYSASSVRHIHTIHVIQGTLFLLVTGAPAIAMILLLRSNVIQRTLTR